MVTPRCYITNDWDIAVDYGSRDIWDMKPSDRWWASGIKMNISRRRSGFSAGTFGRRDEDGEPVVESYYTRHTVTDQMRDFICDETIEW